MELRDIKTVAITGTGTMGKGIVQSFASAGYVVNCYDVAGAELERLVPLVNAMQETLVEGGLLTREAADQSVGRIRTFSSLNECLGNVQLVVEAVPEMLSVKLPVYEQMDREADPEVIFASNTSGLSITKLGSATGRPEKVAGFHFWNPAHLMPLVEVTKGEKTSSEVAELLLALATRLGKKPILVRREVPGFIGNRLQCAVLREALHLVQEGFASAEDVDTAMKAGPGIRYAFLGPLETADLGGLDVFTSISNYLFEDLGRATKAQPYMADLVKEGRLGVKTGRGFYEYGGKTLSELLSARDEKLIKVLTSLKKTD
ncbi:3-hydroxyacyl-CoA dehydrogenase family protein [Candidatus Bathyarchaeota archaeon]|nr:3-hydroxyacyl-CoA dehydrogenase family protein [Candidatus Bathyarchaeota archaeon]